MINHILFADENLIFCKANREASQQMLVLFKQYALASGQCINTDKTTIIFSKNVKEDVKEEVLVIWGCRGVAQYEKCLGLPPIVGRSRKNALFDIKTKLWQQLQT